LAAHIGGTAAHFPLAGHIVVLQPAVGAAVHDALAAQDHAVLAALQLIQGVLDVRPGIGAGRLDAPAGEHFVGVVAVVVMVMMAAMAFAVVVVLVLIVVMMFVLLLMVMVLMLLILMMVLVFVLVMVVMMVTAAAHAVFVVVMVMMLVLVLLILAGMGGVGLGGQGQQTGGKVLPLRHGLEDLRAGQILPGCSDDGGGGVLFPQQGHRSGHLVGVGAAGAAEQDAAGVLYLVVVELAKVLHIQLDLVDVGHRHKAGQLHVQRLGHC